MTRLIVLILTVAAVWMGWWAFASTMHDKQIHAWIDARRAEGWAADISDLTVAGFPNRLDTTITGVHLADPETGIAWEAPFVQFLSLAYKPNQVIAVLPPDHTFSTPAQTITIAHDSARGSLFLEPALSLPLERAIVVAEKLKASSSLGWDMALDQGRFAVEKVPATETSYRIGAELTGLVPASAGQIVAPNVTVPGIIDKMHLDATLELTAPLDRYVLEDARPQITSIQLDDLSVRWGGATLLASGALTVDAEGVPTGQIALKAAEWRKVLAMAAGTGVIVDKILPTLERGLGFLAALQGSPETLDAPLVFERGGMSLGPIPLGPAPRIVLR